MSIANPLTPKDAKIIKKFLLSKGLKKVQKDIQNSRIDGIIINRDGRMIMELTGGEIISTLFDKTEKYMDKTYEVGKDE